MEKPDIEFFKQVFRKFESGSHGESGIYFYTSARAYLRIQRTSSVAFMGKSTFSSCGRRRHGVRARARVILQKCNEGVRERYHEVSRIKYNHNGGEQLTASSLLLFRSFSSAGISRILSKSFFSVLFPSKHSDYSLSLNAWNRCCNRVIYNIV